MEFKKITKVITFFLMAVGVSLSGCTEAKFAVHVAKRIKNAADIPVAGQGRYKVGRPYQIAGQWYSPKVDYSYSEEGTASWYGPGFHGKKTANGEIYNQRSLTAAHRTLPLPSLVRVTNLENGRSVNVRVNDRGPFAHGRIIDMSELGAEILGFRKKGTARVRVDILPQESRELARSMGASPERYQEASTIKASPDSADTPKTKVVSSESIRSPESVFDDHARNDGSRTSIQVGSFTEQRRALDMKARVSRLAPAQITTADINGNTFYRVHLLVPKSEVELAQTK